MEGQLLNMDKLEEYRTDHLILLVGGNPLPNYVAGRLLAKRGATIWLLHSDGSDGGPSTKLLADNLERLFKQHNSNWTIKPEPIPDADNLGIEQRVQSIAKQIESGSVGLNYTGGTKPMATHAYRVIERVFAKREDVWFSYLDPRKLAMRIDRVADKPEILIPILKDPNLRQEVQLSVGELADLHGYTPASSNEQWPSYEEEPRLAAVCDAIVKVHLDHPPKSRDDSTQYEKWVRLSRQEDQEWHLPDLDLYPELKPIVTGLQSGFGQTATEENLAKALLPQKQSPQFRSCAKWFEGMYLEAYVEHAFAQAAQQVEARVWTGSPKFEVKDKTDDFDLDVSAMLGYQFFAVACQSTFRKERAKEHFLEVFVRTRQLGGDEARAALVCYVQDAQRLEAELVRSWDAKDKVRVFGRKEIQDGLTNAFLEWFMTANR